MGSILTAFALTLTSVATASPVFQVGRGMPVAEEAYVNPGNSISADPKFFPIGVWYQDPETTADEFQEIGINTFIGQFRGNKPASLQAVRDEGMYVIAPQDELALSGAGEEVVRAWHNPDDEPEIGRLDELGRRIKPRDPVPPSEVVGKYEQLHSAGAGLPVYVNFGPGVAFEERSQGYERYSPYIAGADIVSFDVYPLNPAVYGEKEDLQLSLVGKGVRNLRAWAPDKPLFAFIETTSVHDNGSPPTYEEMRAEVWLALTAGANGIEYFCHAMEPRIVESACIEDPETKASLSRINKEIAALARVLNSKSRRLWIPARADFSIRRLSRRIGGSTYLLTVSEEVGGDGTAVFDVPGVDNGRAYVLNEDRVLPIRQGKLVDRYGDYSVHLYRIFSSQKALCRSPRHRRACESSRYSREPRQNPLGKPSRRIGWKECTTLRS